MVLILEKSLVESNACWLIFPLGILRWLRWCIFPLSSSAHPVRRRISMWGCGAVTLGVWLLSLALAAPPSLYTRYLDLRPTGIDLVVCEEFWPNSGNLRLVYSCFILTTSYMIPLLSVSISYCAITVSLKRYSVPGEPSNSQQRWSQRRKRTFTLLVASVLAFALCWLPLQVSVRSRPWDTKLKPNQFDINSGYFSWLLNHFLTFPSHASCL